jgi:hypothetical protein
MPARDVVWRQLCDEMQGRWIKGSLMREPRVQVDSGDWTLTLDVHLVSNGDSSVPYTRMRAPFVNRDGFRFSLYRAGLFTHLGKLLGTQDLEIGDPVFDAKYVIRSNQPEKVRVLLANPRIRELLDSQPRLFFTVRDDEGWFGARYPDGVDQLLFDVPVVIREPNVLRPLFDLFTETLQELERLDSGEADERTLLLRTLEDPGGEVSEKNAVLWKGDERRRRAAGALGRLKEARAVEPLIRALSDPDIHLRRQAIKALASIGDARAVPALIPLLGVIEGDALTSDASAALHELDHGEVADALAEALAGNHTALSAVQPELREPIIQALIGALGGPTAPNAAQALAEIGAVEALPALRAALQPQPWLPGAPAPAVEEAIRALERRQALPRPAASAEADRRALPLPAGQAPAHVDDLPLPGAGH